MSTLGQAADFLSGGTPKKGIPEFWNGDISWYSASNMTRRFLKGDEPKITQAGLASGSRLAPKGATLLLVRGSGLFNLIPICFADEPVAFNQDVKAICAKPHVDPLFLHFWIESLRKKLNENVGVTGIGAGKFDLSFLQTLPFPDVVKDEQETIGVLASSFDRKIDLNQRMNATLEAMAQAIFKDWFVDFGPTRAKLEGLAPYLVPHIWSLFPDRLDDEGKPVGWNKESLYDQAIWVNGAAYKDMHFSSEPDALPVVKIAELKSGITKTTRFTSTNLGERYKIRNGELLFSWSGNPDTSIDTFVWTSGNAWLNQHIFAVRPNGKRSQAFLYGMLKFLRSEFAEIARNKQTTGLGHVTQQDLIRLKITVPSKNVETAFEEIAGPLHARFTKNLFENQALGATRDFLLPNLLSGEVRVKDARKIAGEPP